jgi:hypothetical protein
MKKCFEVLDVLLECCWLLLASPNEGLRRICPFSVVFLIKFKFYQKLALVPGSPWTRGLGFNSSGFIILIIYCRSCIRVYILADFLRIKINPSTNRIGAQYWESPDDLVNWHCIAKIELGLRAKPAIYTFCQFFCALSCLQYGTYVPRSSCRASDRCDGRSRAHPTSTGSQSGVSSLPPLLVLENKKYHWRQIYKIFSGTNKPIFLSPFVYLSVAWSNEYACNDNAVSALLVILT